jgi:glycolate oxidase iron-sulfur subunit
MRGLVEGRLGMTSTFTSHIDLCLGCRGCESVCPSGVPYGQLLEAARAEIVSGTKASMMTRLLHAVLKHVFARPLLLKALLAATRWLRNTGLPELAVRSGFGSKWKFALALLASSRSRIQTSTLQRTERIVERASVSLLRGCVMEGLFDSVNRATERVLEQNGYKLIDAKEQVCCGALHAHAGILETARELARRNIDAFIASGCELIVVNSAGCGAAMKEYGHLLGNDHEYSERAREFSSRVLDVLELLAHGGMTNPSGGFSHSVAYDAPCHLIHAQRVINEPLEVLKQIPGIRLVPLAGFETCCGGAGVYNVQHPELSNQVLSDKIETIRSSGVEFVVTPNPGCIMQIGAGMLVSGLDVKVAHPIELLDAAYSDTSKTHES